MSPSYGGGGQVGTMLPSFFDAAYSGQDMPNGSLLGSQLHSPPPRAFLKKTQQVRERTQTVAVQSSSCSESGRKLHAQLSGSSLFLLTRSMQRQTGLLSLPSPFPHPEPLTPAARKASKQQAVPTIRVLFS